MPASAAVSSTFGVSSVAKTSLSPTTKFTSEHTTMLITFATSGETCMLPVNNLISARLPPSETRPLPKWKVNSRFAIARADCAPLVRSRQV
jgi:hypothetical protein